MEQIAKYVIIITSLMTIKLTLTESKNDTKSKIERRYYEPIFVNVCNIQDRRSKLHCYCDDNKPKMATKADCWVFAGGISKEDPIWPKFSSQSEIEHLIFNVRSDEALTFIPAKAIVRLNKLKHLSIQFGTITTIPSYAFTNSSTIRQLVLKSNKITNLERHAFSQMKTLSDLSLDENQISEIGRDVFFGLPNLQNLHLSNNNLTLIHEGCFKHLNNLIELKLDFNYISVVTREMLEGLDNLSRLNLRYNKLTMIGNLAFSELWRLKELMLDHNAIEYISERAFGGLTQLWKLTLAGNKLTSFYKDILEDVRSLIQLDLRDNLLETICYETVRVVVENEKSAAAVFYLDGNPLKCDCRLSWIYVLKNETKDGSLRHALEKVSCVDDTTERPALQEDDEHIDNILSDDSYDYDDKTDINEVTEHNARHKKTRNKKLTDIPLETLPCPKELVRTIEENYGQPVQNEIRLKTYSKVGKPVPCFMSVLFVSLLI